MHDKTVRDWEAAQRPGVPDGDLAAALAGPLIRGPLDHQQVRVAAAGDAAEDRVLGRQITCGL